MLFHLDAELTAELLAAVFAVTEGTMSYPHFSHVLAVQRVRYLLNKAVQLSRGNICFVILLLCNFVFCEGVVVQT